MNSQAKRTKREEQAIRRRRELIDAALRVFAERGFDGSTILDVGNEAGVSPGLIYHYFDSKEAMLDEIVEQNSYLPEIAHILEIKKDLPVDEFLRTLAFNFYRLLGERSELFSIFVREGRLNNTVRQAWQRLLNEGIRMVKGYLEQQVANGKLKPHYTEVTARALGSAVVVLRLTEGIWPSDSPTGEVFIRELIDNLLKGIEQT